MPLPTLPGQQALNCTPPLGISDEVKEYLKALQEGERVIECGKSGLTGRLGTVYISKKDGPTKGAVCVRWDKALGEEGQMGSSVTGGTRRIVDAGSFREYALAYEAQLEPAFRDGCDKDGFPGGCERAGHTPENCPGFAIGDTVRFSEHHHAAGDTAVIVAEEIWIDDKTCVAWDGVGERPIFTGETLLPHQPVRFLLRLLEYGKPREESLASVNYWRKRCLQFPHDYPFASLRDMELVYRPEILRLNGTNEHGAALGLDRRLSVSCISDSEASARRDLALIKATHCIPLSVPPREPGAKISFSCQEAAETKVAGPSELTIGFQFWCAALFGIAKATVIEIEGTKARAVVGGGRNVTYLRLKDDGWYDQHMVVDEAAIEKMKVTFTCGKTESDGSPVKEVGDG